MIISDIDREIVRLKEDENKTYKEIGKLLGISGSKASKKYYESMPLIRKESEDPIAALDITPQDYRIINRIRTFKDVKLKTINDLVEIIKKDKFVIYRGVSRNVENHVIVALEKKLGYRIKDTFEIEYLWDTNYIDKTIFCFNVNNCDGSYEGLLVYDFYNQSSKLYSEKQLPYDKEEIRSKVLIMMRERGIMD